MFKLVLLDSSHLTRLTELQALYTQLGPHIPPMDAQLFNKLLGYPCTSVWLALDSDTEVIAGSITLVGYPIPTSYKCVVEDVVVDVRYRNLGLGTYLVNHVLNEAKNKGAEYVDLTSRPERVEANKLYQKLGFEQRTTNVYRLQL